MKFNITRTSYYGGDEAPIDNDKLYKETLMFNRLTQQWENYNVDNINNNNYYTRIFWVLEIFTIEELMEFINIHEIVIIDDGNEIEIYDGYRE